MGILAILRSCLLQGDTFEWLVSAVVSLGLVGN